MANANRPKSMQAILEGEVEGREDEAWIDVHSDVTHDMVVGMADICRFEKGELDNEQMSRAMWNTINALQAHFINIQNGLDLIIEHSELPKHAVDHMQALIECINIQR